MIHENETNVMRNTIDDIGEERKRHPILSLCVFAWYIAKEGRCTAPVKFIYAPKVESETIRLKR